MADVSDAFSGTLANFTQRTDEYHTGTIEIASGRIQVVDGDTEAAMYWSADSFADDQWASVVIAQASNTYSGGGPICRMQTGSFSCYMAYVANDNGANNLILQRYDAGSGTTLASKTKAIVANDVVKIEAIGTSIKVYVNGVEELSATDSTYTSGYPGIEMYDAGTGTKFQLDSFAAGPTSGAGTDVVAGVGLLVVVKVAKGAMTDFTPVLPTILMRSGGYDAETGWLSDPDYAGVTIASHDDVTPSFSVTLPP